jgi:hypothetical protein
VTSLFIAAWSTLEAAVQRLLTGVGVIIVIVLAGWWAFTNWGYDYYLTKGPCGTERVWSSMDAFDRIAAELERMRVTWNDAYPNGQDGLVDSMTRKSQRLLEEVHQIDVPLCMRGVKEHMAIGLESLNAAFQAASQNQYISFDRGTSAQITNIFMAKNEMALIEQCVPFCESIVFNNLIP